MPFSPSIISHGKQILARTARWLSKPAVGLPEPERRRNHVLAWMQITLILLIGLALVLILLFINGNTPRDRLYNYLMAGLLVGLLAAFGLNRRGRYRVSTYLTVFLTFIGPWSALLGDPTVLHGDFVPLTYLVLAATAGKSLS